MFLGLQWSIARLVLLSVLDQPTLLFQLLAFSEYARRLYLHQGPQGGRHRWLKLFPLVQVHQALQGGRWNDKLTLLLCGFLFSHGFPPPQYLHTCHCFLCFYRTWSDRNTPSWPPVPTIPPRMCPTPAFTSRPTALCRFSLTMSFFSLSFVRFHFFNKGHFVMF